MRDAPRLHVENDLAAGAAVPLDADRSHYLLHVMRAAVGAEVRVFNAAGGEWQATVGEAGKRGAVLRVERQVRAPAAMGFAPVLIFAPLKRDATETVVRMATELGAGRIQPVITRRTVVPRVNRDRLALIAREAAEQCERLDVPEVAEPMALPDLLGHWDAGVPIAAAIERRAAAAPGAGSRAGAVLIGPEGGWAPEELDQLGRAPFVHAVSLGALVLRADTAAAAALATLWAAHGWERGSDVEPG